MVELQYCSTLRATSESEYFDTMPKFSDMNQIGQMMNQPQIQIHSCQVENSVSRKCKKNKPSEPEDNMISQITDTRRARKTGRMRRSPTRRLSTILTGTRVEWYPPVISSVLWEGLVRTPPMLRFSLQNLNQCPMSNVQLPMSNTHCSIANVHDQCFLAFRCRTWWTKLTTDLGFSTLKIFCWWWFLTNVCNFSGQSSSKEF